jgi:ribosome-associated heat shock protein Hsp15
VRVDKWLWVARLTKTRTLAADAVKAGRVKVNGVTAKPSKEVAPGDHVELRTGPLRRELIVLGAAPRRGPAAEAAKLYEETRESVEAREREAAERRLWRAEGGEGGRPTKRDRRLLERLKGRRR